MAEVQTKREMDWKVSMDEASMDDVDALLFLLKVPEDPSFIMHGSTDKKIDKHRKIWFTQVGLRIEMLLASVWDKDISTQEEIDEVVQKDHERKLAIQEKVKSGEMVVSINSAPKGHRKGEAIDWNNEVPPEFPEFYETIETLDDVVKVVRYWREPEFGNRDRLVWLQDIDAGNRTIKTILGKLEEEFGVKIME